MKVGLGDCMLFSSFLTDGPWILYWKPVLTTIWCHNSGWHRAMTLTLPSQNLCRCFFQPLVAIQSFFLNGTVHVAEHKLLLTLVIWPNVILWSIGDYRYPRIGYPQGFAVTGSKYSIRLDSSIGVHVFKCLNQCVWTWTPCSWAPQPYWKKLNATALHASVSGKLVTNIAIKNKGF